MGRFGSLESFSSNQNNEISQPTGWEQLQDDSETESSDFSIEDIDIAQRSFRRYSIEEGRHGLERLNDGGEMLPSSSPSGEDQSKMTPSEMIRNSLDAVAYGDEVPTYPDSGDANPDNHPSSGSLASLSPDQLKHYAATEDMSPEEIAKRNDELARMLEDSF